MTPDEAAWVRANVWTAAMRLDSTGPECACQYGPSTWCVQGDCRRCQAADDLPFPETYIANKRAQVLTFPVPYAPPCRSATGQQISREAAVWLADRVCRWRCSCPCHSGAKPATTATGTVQPTLFQGVA